MRLYQPSLQMDWDALKSALRDFVVHNFAHLLIPPSQFIIDYGVRLGYGRYGEVFPARLTMSSAAPTSVAVKQMIISKLQCEERHKAICLIARELKTWAKAKHPNILELLGISFSERNEYAYLLSPHMIHGDVKNYIKKKLPNHAIRLKLVKGITSALHYLHTRDKPICHGDLKPLNVLVNDDNDAVLCDFGLATFVTEPALSSGQTILATADGTTRYMSPEFFTEGVTKHTLKSDIWAWACTVFEVVTDCEPYPGAKGKYHVILSLSQGEAPGSVDLLKNMVRHTNDACNPSLGRLESVILDCWNSDAGQRPSSSDLLARLGFLAEVEAS